MWKVTAISVQYFQFCTHDTLHNCSCDEVNTNVMKLTFMSNSNKTVNLFWGYSSINKLQYRI